MKTLVEQLEEKIMKESTSAAFKDVQVVRDAIRSLRIPDNAKFELCGGAVNRRVLEKMLCDVLENFMAERRYQNKIEAIVQRVVIK